MSAEWVCPHCPTPKYEKEIQKIKGLNRLFAYPCKPCFDNGRLVIMDSGAHGLSMYGGKMTFKYMQKLSEHYEKYYRDGRTLCVAPDEFLNPEQSMLNFQKWHKNNLFPKISPVLQSEKKYVFNCEILKFQADFYREYSDTLLIGDNNLTSSQAKAHNIEKLFEYCKSIGYKWIHYLGAGWNLEEIKNWSEMRFLDSFDSTAYYLTKDEREFGSLNPLENVKNIIEMLKEKQYED